MRKTILLLYCLLYSAIINASVSKNTFVDTLRGHIAIECLKIGDTVFSFDENFVVNEGIVTAIQDYHTDEIIELITENDCTLRISKQQKVFVVDHKEWHEAHALKPGELLFKKDGSYIKIKDIKVISPRQKMRSITVEKHHNFFVGESEILVHNFAFVLPVLTWGGGAALAWFEGVTCAGIATALVGLVVREVVIDKFEKATGITVDEKESVAYIGAAKGAYNQPEEIGHSPKFPTDSAGCVVTAGKTLQDVIGEAKPGRKTKGPSTQYVNPGGFKAANDDFDAIMPTDVQNKENGVRVGKLPDGRTIVVRPTSTSPEKSPTLEVQGKKPIKIRYPESKK